MSELFERSVKRSVVPVLDCGHHQRMNQDLRGTQGEQPDSNENHLALGERSSHQISKRQDPLSSLQPESVPVVRHDVEPRVVNCVSGSDKQRDAENERQTSSPFRQESNPQVPTSGL